MAKEEMIKRGWTSIMKFPFDKLTDSERNYLVWNNSICQEFFNESMASKDVLLYINTETINRIGEQYGQSVEDFIESIKEGLTQSGAGLWGKVKKFAMIDSDGNINWRQEEFSYPPYIGFLAFFVLAAGKEGDYSQLAYYKRLWSLLGIEDREDTYPSFDKMHVLWEDLEQWCNIDRKEELGRFTVREPYVPHHKHVGLPRTQLVISEEERKCLPFIFAKAELDPFDPPAPEIINQVLLDYGEEFLNRRTQRILKVTNGELITSKEVLLDRIIDDLSSWDGSLPERPDIEPRRGRRRKRTYSPSFLRVCIDFQSRWRSYFRFKTEREFPSGGFEFICTNDEEGISKEEYICQESSGTRSIDGKTAWSQPLRVDGATQHSYLEAKNLDWKKIYKFLNKRYSLRIRTRGGEIKLFKKGIGENLSGWIETVSLVRNIPFYLACTTDWEEKIKQWGEENCDSFSYRSFQGLSQDWVLFKGHNARNSFPGVIQLTLSSSIRLRFIGGIRIKGNTYLNFAPPSFLILNSTGEEEVRCFSEQKNKALKIKFDSETSIFQLSKKVRETGTLTITLKESREGRIIQKRHITLIEPQIPSDHDYDHVTRLDRFGEKILSHRKDENHLQGANVSGNIEGDIKSGGLLPIELSHKNKLIFLGSSIGEYFDWYGDRPISPDLPWSPVWVLSKVDKDRWVVNSTGITEGPKDPLGANSCDQTKWIKAILYTPGLEKPRIMKLKELWRKYEKTAKERRRRKKR